MQIFHITCRLKLFAPLAILQIEPLWPNTDIPGILVAYARPFEVVFDDLYRRWKLMNQENKAFPIALRESVAVIDRLCNIFFTGDPKALQLKLFENMGLKEGISCRGWPWISPAHLDLRPLSGYINKSTWRDAYQKPKLLSLSSTRYHYGDTVAEPCLQAASITDFKEASLLVSRSYWTCFVCLLSSLGSFP